jgi:Ca-activated chloride channel family protein
LFAGQERRVWVTLGFPHEALDEYDVGRITLSYDALGERHMLPLGSLPRIACVDAEDTFYSRLDGEAWSRSVIVDAYNQMKEEVAQEVKAGRRDEALRRVRAFRDSTEQMNERVGSEAVGAQLDHARELEHDVAAAFEGKNQGERQNRLSKMNAAAAIDARRAGAKR